MRGRRGIVQRHPEATAKIRRNREGEVEPDAELRDPENVPLKESVQAYFESEVLRQRELAVIEGEITALEADIVRLPGEVAA